MLNVIVFHIRQPTAKKVAQVPEDKQVVQTFPAKKMEPKKMNITKLNDGKEKMNITKLNDGKDNKNKTSTEKTKYQTDAAIPKPNDVAAHEYQTKYAFCYKMHTYVCNFNEAKFILK